MQALPPAATPVAAQRFRSGDCLIDLARRELIRDGELLHVEAKVFDLIALLVSHAERALSKREIGQALWPDRPVTDAALSQLLRKARRALGDDGETQAFIRTVHGRGLQWLPPAVPVAAEVPRPDPPAEPAGPSGTAASIPAATDAVLATSTGAKDADAPSGELPREPASASPNVDVAAVADARAVSGSGAAWPPPSFQRPAAASRQRRLTLFVLAILALAAVGFVVAERWLPHDEAQAAATRVLVLPTRDDTADAQLAWASQGLMVLLSGLIGDHAPIQTETMPPSAGSSDAAGSGDPQALGATIGASHVLASTLRRLGPLYELELVLVTRRTGAQRVERLRGGTPAALAADGALRVRRLLAPDDDRSDDGLAGEIADPFLAEAYARGRDAQLRGDHVAAARYFEICLDEDDRLRWPRLGLATSLAGRAQFQAAREHATRVADAAQDDADPALFLQAQRLLASIAFRQGDLDAAALHLDAAMAREIPSDAQLVDLLVARGAIASERGDALAARIDLDRALVLARTLADRRREAQVLLNLAVIDNAQGDVEGAIVRLRTGLDAARAAGDGQLEGSALLNLGGAESNAGRPALAAPLLREAVAQGRQRADRNQEVYAMVLLSRVLATLGAVAQGEDLARQVLAAGDTADNALWQAEGHAALGAIAARRADWTVVFAHLDQALERYGVGGMARGQADVLVQTARFAAHAGDDARLARAIDAYRAAGTIDRRPATDFLPLLEALQLHANGNRDAAFARVRELLGGIGYTDRGPVMQAALMEVGYWDLDATQASFVLRHPAWTDELAQHPDAIARRIELLRRTGQQDEAESERLRLAALLDDARHAADMDRLRLE